ncbi:thiamine diphosphate-binding protein [Delphinella strobiligena]|nr:thiamine diphosphate-binding protein [Delphinella strobiligena]
MGVPGDFNLQLLDHIYHVPGLRWVGNANELNAAYAADGYARVKGGAGCRELSALNGIAGAMTEQVKVIHVVGQTTRDMQVNRKLIHHSIGLDPDHQVFNKAFRVAGAQLWDKENATTEIDRAIRECFIKSGPVTIHFPLDMVDEQVPMSLLDTPIDLTLPEDEASKKATKDAVKAIIEAVSESRSPVVFIDCLVQRHDAVAELNELVDKLGFPIYASNMGKGLVDEHHSKYVGIYNGTVSSPGLSQAFEASDLVLSFGALLCSQTYSGIYIKTLLAALNGAIDTAQLPKVQVPSLPPATLAHDHEGKAITQSWIWGRIAEFNTSGDVLFGETGTAAFSLPDATFPTGDMQPQQPWAQSSRSTTFATTINGNKRGRTVLVTGDGSLQLTVQELGTMISHSTRPIILLINNAGYTIERVIHGAKQSYNDISPWNYSHALRLFGMNEGGGLPVSGARGREVICHVFE